MLKIKIVITELLMNLSYFLEVRRKDSVFFRLLSSIIYSINRFLFGMIPYMAMNHKEYCQLQNEQCFCIKENRIGYSSNVISYDSTEQQQLIPFPMNDLLLCSHHNVFIQGGSGLVLDMNRRLAINDYCAEMDDDTSYQDTITKKTKQKVLLLKVGRINRYKMLSSGIMINDRYAGNYYHCLYEILIRLLVVDEVNEHIPSNVPLIVDESITKVPSLNKAFKILTKNIHRPILFIHADERLHTDSLYCITPINSIRHRKEEAAILPKYYLFDKEYTLELRNKLLKYQSGKEFPKRFFITRKNTMHRNYNEDEVFSVLKPLGFEQIAPETLSFEEQMRLFHSAEWIVSGSGAAFTNLLFCSTGCRAIIIVGNIKHFLIPVFTSPAYFNECVVRYFGSNTSDEITDIHADFSVDITQLESFIKCLA